MLPTAEQQIRLAVLQQHLWNTARLDVREDSKLAQAFVSGDTTFTAAQVAHQLACMHFLYRYTDYLHSISHVRKIPVAQQNMTKEKIRIETMQRFSHLYVDGWPWLRDHSEDDFPHPYPSTQPRDVVGDVQPVVAPNSGPLDNFPTDTERKPRDPEVGDQQSEHKVHCEV